MSPTRTAAVSAVTDHLLTLNYLEVRKQGLLEDWLAEHGSIGDDTGE